ncbi:hypothetical protein TNCV_3560841 [Trichonephila clavipes]|nr:hypothetical protein TNCV_3560841 [Trichonephila clavipes]
MKECRPVVIKRDPGGYRQYQSDRSIDRPHIWCKRYSDVFDLSRTEAACLKEPIELGRRRGVPCAYPLRSPIRD